MNERVTAVVALESMRGGSLLVVIQPVDEIHSFMIQDRPMLTFEAWTEGDAVRMKLTNPATGAVAYAQGAAPLLEFSRALGVSIES
ncbi:MAG: hypothetical protein JO165_07975 [Candidatus Eremiobacteraeota bacterium]|nr:hypothetical protein [Candidatus Eremiobacteraeota bacterium]